MNKAMSHVSKAPDTPTCPLLQYKYNAGTAQVIKLPKSLVHIQTRFPAYVMLLYIFPELPTDNAREMQYTCTMSKTITVRLHTTTSKWPTFALTKLVVESGRLYDYSSQLLSRHLLLSA